MYSLLLTLTLPLAFPSLRNKLDISPRAVNPFVPLMNRMIFFVLILALPPPSLTKNIP
jgi:hypothetical protein